MTRAQCSAAPPAGGAQGAVPAEGRSVRLRACGAGGGAPLGLRCSPRCGRGHGAAGEAAQGAEVRPAAEVSRGSPSQGWAGGLPSGRAGPKGAGGVVGPPSGLLPGWAGLCGAREAGARGSHPGPEVLREGWDPFPRHAVCGSGGGAVPSASRVAKAAASPASLRPGSSFSEWGGPERTPSRPRGRHRGLGFVLSQGCPVEIK